MSNKVAPLGIFNREILTRKRLLREVDFERQTHSFDPIEENTRDRCNVCATPTGRHCASCMNHICQTCHEHQETA